MTGRLSYVAKYFYCWRIASHALLWAWIKFTSRWTWGLGMLFWHYPLLPPCPLRGLYCAGLNLLPSLHVRVSVLFLCMCVCMYPVRADSEALPLHKWAVENLQVGPSASRMHVFVCEHVCLVTFSSEWKGIVYSEFVTWPKAIYPQTQTVDLCSGWLNRLGIGKLGGSGGGRQWEAVILSFTGNDARRRKREKRKARRENWKKRLESGSGFGKAELKIV